MAFNPETVKMKAMELAAAACLSVSRPLGSGWQALEHLVYRTLDTMFLPVLGRNYGQFAGWVSVLLDCHDGLWINPDRHSLVTAFEFNEFHRYSLLQQWSQGRLVLLN